MRLDAGMRFDSFVVGPANKLAWEAARSAAESPGVTYNPLFIYSGTGLGKTHLLAAIAHRARELQPDVAVIYTPLDTMLRESASKDRPDDEYRDTEILLLDDLQFLGSGPENQRTLFHILDRLLLEGRQVVLACDRPPLELDQLDDRLLSRFSGGLVLEIGRPSLDTRRAILELRLSQLEASVKPEVIDAIARVAIENVRQLKGALNRVLATQRTEQREVDADEVDRILVDVVGDVEVQWLNEEDEPATANEFEEFLTDVSSAVDEALTSAQWQEDLARLILKWEAEGFRTIRLENHLNGDQPVDAGQVGAQFERDIATLSGMREEFERLGSTHQVEDLLKDPDRVAELRTVLEEARRQAARADRFFLDSEKVVWDWPVIEEWLIESWDDGHQR